MFVAESDVILNQERHQTLHAIEARFAGSVLVCAGHEDWWFLKGIISRRLTSSLRRKGALGNFR